MLTAEERQQITRALEEWAAVAPNEPMVGFLGRKTLLTPQEIVQHVQKSTSDGEALLEVLEHGVRREGIKAAVARLRRPLPRY